MVFGPMRKNVCLQLSQFFQVNSQVSVHLDIKFCIIAHDAPEKEQNIDIF